MPTLASIPITKNSTLGDFCNPKSAITLTASSAMVLAFTTTLGNAFGISMALTALILSAIFGLFQVINSIEPLSLSNKVIYTIINTLVIFHVARGGNMTLVSGENVLRDAKTEQVSFVPSIVSTAEATEYSVSRTKWNYQPIKTPIILATNTNKPPPIFRPW